MPLQHQQDGFKVWFCLVWKANGVNHWENLMGIVFTRGIVVFKTYGFTGASAKGAGWTSAGWITHGLSLSASLLTAFGTSVAHQKDDAHMYIYINYYTYIYIYVHAAYIHSSFMCASLSLPYFFSLKHPCIFFFWYISTNICSWVPRCFKNIVWCSL